MSIRVVLRCGAMALDPKMKQVLDQMAAMDAPPMWELTPEQARSMLDAMVGMMGAVEDVASVEDRSIDLGDRSLPVRIYRPECVGEARPRRSSSTTAAASYRRPRPPTTATAGRSPTAAPAR